MPGVAGVTTAAKDRSMAAPSDHASHGHGAGLTGLALGALGIVYGDIGTSPLYAFRETFMGHGHELEVTQGNVLGVLSLIFYSLVAIIGVKYLVFVMRADNDGEGGILALTSLLARPENGKKGARWAMLMVGLFGTALLYGDGMITPSISVLAAVEGAVVVSPALHNLVVPLAVVILIGLFSIQSRGTATIGKLFGPVMVVWFGTLAVLGTIQLVHEPSVLRALNPLYAVRFFTENGFPAFLSLGAVFLVVTGGEALYADMGHFGRRPIMVGWFTVVFPALLLNYFGQGALLLRDPSLISHPFFGLAPSWGVVPLVVLATVATVIASQALISGLFSLTMQAVQLDYAPRVDIDHTSPQAYGQIYIPVINWGLLVACIGLVVGFRSSAALAAAYGVAVTATMVITTLLFAVVVRRRFGWPLPGVIALAVVFLIVEGAFLGANLFKIPAGGWFPLVVGVVVFTVLTTWHTGRAAVRRLVRGTETSLTDYLGDVLHGPRRPARVPGTAIYMFRDRGFAPPALIANINHNHVLHERVVIVSVITTRVPRVDPAQRSEVRDCGQGIWDVALHYGFMEDANVPIGLTEGEVASLSIDVSTATYFVAAERLRVTDVRTMARWREHIFAGIHRNATSAAQYFGLPPHQVMIVGLPLDI
jgi:KUP system potassium uptake protein